MSYYRRRRYPYSRYRYSTRGRPKKKSLGRQIGYLSRCVRDLKKGQEYKVAEISHSGLICNGSAAAPSFTYLLPNISQGTGKDERIGTKITQKRIDLKMLFKNNRGTPTDCMVRCIIARSRSLLDATISTTAGDILKTISNGNASFMSMREITEGNSNRFKIYFDKSFALSTTGDGHDEKFIKWGVTLNNEMQFNDDSLGDATDVKKGRWYILLCSTEDTGTANCPQCDIIGRMRFTDS